jgi:DNA-binding XRE family transcriptional regulator
MSRLDPEKIKRHTIPWKEVERKIFSPKEIEVLDREYKKLQKKWKRENERLIAKKIRRLRDELGMTQQQLADLLGTSRTNIVALESGRRNMTVETLNKVAKATGKKLKITFE